MKSPLKDVNPTFVNMLGPLKEIIPAGSNIDSFLFFSGALEFNLAEANRPVTAHTTQYVIYEFWMHAIDDPQRVKEMASYIVKRAGGDELLFNTFQKDWLDYRDPYMRAAMFFVLNRSSSTGQLTAGEYLAEGVTPISIARLGNLNPLNFKIQWSRDMGLVESLEPNTLTGEYCLIPAGKFSYNFFEEGKSRGWEETSVSHQLLHARVKESARPVVILYKFHPGVLQLYKDFNIRMYDKFGNVTDNPENCEDLIVANF